MNWLVVARYNEDTAWTERVPDGWQVLVVQKDVDVPNEGREATSYLWAMNRLFHEPLDHELVAFVQGNPFDHCPDLLERLPGLNGAAFTPLGNWRVTCDGEGRPHHTGLPVKADYEGLLHRPFPGEIEFTAGAQFAITGRALRRVPAWLYRKLFELVPNPWVMERLWEPWLTGSPSVSTKTSTT